MKLETWNTTHNKKKCAITKTYIKSGTGTIKINNIEINHLKNKLEYTKEIYSITSLFNITPLTILIFTKNGGKHSQINSIKISLIHSLISFNKTLKLLIPKHPYLKNDTRIVEQKKIGLVKSRKKKQYTKR